LPGGPAARPPSSRPWPSCSAAEARVQQQALQDAERARREAEAAARADATLTEVENALKRAELLHKTNAFVNQKPPEPEPAPAPRAVGP
jgi:hypothetical protein